VRRRSYHQSFRVCEGISAVTRRTGHILGAASVELRIGDENPVVLVFSGDLGRWGRPLLRDPELVTRADTLLIESTYGDRVHPADALPSLAKVVNEAVGRGGALLVPAFAVDRTQELIWGLRRLEDEERIPVLPVYVDSPMAIEVTDLYCRHREEHVFESKILTDRSNCPLHTHRFHLIQSREESKSLNAISGPMIVIAGSGMATGGRILHHLEQRLADPKTTVLLVGYQAAGTRGRSLQEGAAALRMHGREIPVRARVEEACGLSAHADRDDVMRWLTGFKSPPCQTYVIHGEIGPAEKLAEAIRTNLNWNVSVAQDGDTVELFQASCPSQHQT
jgi:metallo-beta-lactamase family protein